MYDILFFYNNQIYINGLISEIENTKFQFTLCNSVKEAIFIVCNQPIKACAIEQAHPDSMSFLSALRLVDNTIPTLLLCEGNSAEDKMHALDIGCDEFIFKPVVSKELKLRLNMLLGKNEKHLTPNEEDTFKIGQSTVDFTRRILSVNGQDVVLTRKEAALLKLLLLNKSKLVAHEYILGEIWKTGDYYASKSLVVYINKLRKKMKEDPTILIENLHGSGYILKEAGTGTVQVI